MINSVFFSYNLSQPLSSCPMPPPPCHQSYHKTFTYGFLIAIMQGKKIGTLDTDDPCTIPSSTLRNFITCRILNQSATYSTTFYSWYGYQYYLVPVFPLQTIYFVQFLSLQSPPLAPNCEFTVVVPNITFGCSHKIIRIYGGMNWSTCWRMNPASSCLGSLFQII